MTRGNDNLAIVPRERASALGVRDDDGLDVTRRGPGRRTGRRVALYSHDTQGLGHVRRNSLLAAAMVAADPGVSVLLVSGAREAAALPLPERTGLAIVPELAKDGLGGYYARASDCSLDHVVARRSVALERVLADYAPDLLVVDKVSRGFGGELEPALRHVRREHGTRTVLGLRDVLDDVATTRQEWEQSRTPDAIETLYDQVWVYGDPALFDPAVEYGWSEAVRAKVRYTGYLGTGRERLLPAAASNTGASTAPAVSRSLHEPYVLALLGGGQDGAAVADAFARAAYPPGHVGVLVTGPYLPTPELERLRQVARRRGDLRVDRFVSDVPSLARSSTATISMGGYNSVCELLAARRPALVVPRMAPRREQAMRAERFARHGLLDVLSLADLGPDPVTRWLADALVRPDRPFPPIDLRGLSAVPGLVAELLGADAEGGVRHVG